MLRIAYIVSHLGQTGVNNVVCDLVTLMQAHGHECRVYYFSDIDDPVSFPCATERIGSWWQPIDFGCFDVVHTHGLKPDAYVFLRRPRHSRTRFISTIHCYVFDDFHDLYGYVKGSMLAGVYLLAKYRHDRIVALSAHAQKYYERFYSGEKLTYVYNTRVLNRQKELSPQEKAELHHFKQDGILIGMNGVLIRRKGVDLMLRALSLLPEQVKLFLVGEGACRQEFESMAVSLGVSHRVYFAGVRPAAHRYLPYYDVLALPSRAEGFPLALLEAAAYGANVVVSDLPIVKECFDSSVLQIFPLSGGAEALAQAIDSALVHPERGTRLLKQFTSAHSPEKWYKDYLKNYIVTQ